MVVLLTFYADGPFCSRAYALRQGETALRDFFPGWPPNRGPIGLFETELTLLLIDLYSQLLLFFCALYHEWSMMAVLVFSRDTKVFTRINIEVDLTNVTGS